MQKLRSVFAIYGLYMDYLSRWDRSKLAHTIEICAIKLCAIIQLLTQHQTIWLFYFFDSFVCLKIPTACNMTQILKFFWNRFWKFLKRFLYWKKLKRSDFPVSSYLNAINELSSKTDLILFILFSHKKSLLWIKRISLFCQNR